MSFTEQNDSLEGARSFDAQDKLKRFRDEFVFPKTATNENQLYFAGHSLGLMPKRAKEFINAELDAWATYGVEGHFKGQHPWLPYHEFLTESLTRIVGAEKDEVVAMNSLTVNLHLMLVSFYRPTKSRYKILIENNTFPSDKYAVDSQAQFHGFVPQDAIVELKPREGEMVVRPEDIEKQIATLGDSLALVMLGNCNYLSGQQFPFDVIVKAGHRVGAVVGFNLAHGAGNLALELHKWNVDFAVWCSYKYLNSGPGGIAGAFVHQKHLKETGLPRFAGWWGHDKKTRFKMGPNFQPLPTVEAWQLSNPPIFQLASLRASLSLFDEATMAALSQKSRHLTNYFEWLLRRHLDEKIEILTPESRGSMLCLRLKNKNVNAQKWQEGLHSHDVVADFREPNIIRATPIPLYNSYEDVFRLVDVLKRVSNGV